ncbi:catalase family protein [Stenotrophomonas sp. CFBP 13718]|uniref:catalase family protein n=1 Tax=Stenotrophomonas sp. CFBP 13718 TaxID=2775304 RepID=UPI00177F8DE6|nr:catalase family protein [Stenotrophomonas sp. CFBP 13718]MBD8694561.1 catalase family protein [Stenotrophomonas sp. CFBP 13718]
MNSIAPPVAFDPSVEQPEKDEAEHIAALSEVFTGMARTVADEEGHAHRAVHAKGQGLLKGELQVFEGLPPELAQGLFASPGRHRALMRLSSPPAEQLPDTVSTPRAVAVKVLEVAGERLPGDEEQHTQDFLMVNGPAFSTPGVAGFLRAARLLASTTERMPRTKRVISATLRAAEAALEAVGTESATLKSMGGEPQHHPLGETFFSQVPYRYGAYIAKFSLAPLSDSLLALKDQSLTGSEDAQRDAVVAFFATLQEPAVWALRVQLCRDLERMPVEDASVAWPEEESPWQEVAHLIMPRQAAWQEGESQAAEDALAFAPWHALAAHQPLGSINRARRVVMAGSRRFRSEFNRCPIHEPRS